MSGITALRKYYNSRFLIIPWVPVSMGLAFAALMRIDYHFVLISAYLYLAIMFYRLFDDLHRLDYEQRDNSTRSYHQDRQVLTKHLALPFIIYMLSTYFILPIHITIKTGIFVLLNSALYYYLKNQKLGQFISILKYPFLLAMIAGIDSYTWLLVFTIAVAAETISLQRNSRNYLYT